MAWCYIVRYNSLLQIVIAAWNALFTFELAMSGITAAVRIIMAMWQASNLKKHAPNNNYLTRSPSRIVGRGQGGLQGSKGTLWPDFQVNT
jgi:hypothetical protein